MEYISRTSSSDEAANAPAGVSAGGHNHEGYLPSPDHLDASRTLFRVGRSRKVSELLYALPMLKARPILTEGPTPSRETGSMFVEIQWLDGEPRSAEVYDEVRSPVTLDNVKSEAVRFPLARLGIRFEAFKIDSDAGVRSTALNPMDWKGRAAATSVLRRLDEAIGRSIEIQSDFDFRGLPALCEDRTEKVIDIEEAAQTAIVNVTPNGRGVGEGPHCLIGGPKVLKKLMSTPSGQRSGSGWKFDPRSRMIVYHYMGLPFYRTDLVETAEARIYAANLGPSGLNLVHAYGTAESFGLEVEEHCEASSGKREMLVHGAFGLFTWEPECLFEVSGIEL